MTSGKVENIPFIGLTGGIGSGKTVVAEMFRDAGASVINADILAKEILWNNKDIHKQVIAVFGPSVMGKNGIVDKEILSSVVFADRDSIEKINRIIHPAVSGEIQAILTDIRKNKRNSMVVEESALIYESSIEQKFDCVVSVSANEDTRIRRIKNRDNKTEEEIRKRMRLQVDEKIHRQKSDYLINNSGSFEDLKNLAAEVITAIKEKYNIKS